MARIKKSGPKPCHNCGEIFHADNGHARYCSKECQKEKRNARHAERAKAKRAPEFTKECHHCGAQFSSWSRAVNALTCSPECGAELIRLKRNARSREYAKENPERMRAAYHKRKSANPEKIKAQDKATRERYAAKYGRDHINDLKRKAYANNPEAYREAKRKWQLENPEKISDQKARDLQKIREREIFALTGNL